MRVQNNNSNVSTNNDQSTCKASVAKKRRVNRRKKEHILTSHDLVSSNTSEAIIGAHQETDQDLLVSRNKQPNIIPFSQSILNKSKSNPYHHVFLNNKIKIENCNTNTSKLGNNVVYTKVYKSKQITATIINNKSNTLSTTQGRRSIEKRNLYHRSIASCSGSNHANKNFHYGNKDVPKDDAHSTDSQDRYKFNLENGEETTIDSVDSNPLLLHSSDNDSSSSICDEDKDKLQDLLEEILLSRQKAFFKSPFVIKVLQNLANKNKD